MVVAESGMGKGLRCPVGGMSSAPCGVGVVGCSGGVLLSHDLAVAVPSALEGLASGFGMGPGVSPPLWPPEHRTTPTTEHVCGVGVQCVDASTLLFLSCLVHLLRCGQWWCVGQVLGLL